MKAADTPLATDPIAQFRTLVTADSGLARSLSLIEDAGCFIQSAIGSAAAHGIALEAATVQAQIASDPLGLKRWFATPVTEPRWPPAPWLPTNVSAPEGRIFVDWACFGERPLTDPFFEGSIRRALALPFNRMFRLRTRWEDFVGDDAAAQSLEPSGFIFHMSRCGSTLVSQMLAALPQNIAVSEPAPLDAVVQLSRTWTALPAEQHVRHLKAMVAAFGRKRSGAEKRYFIKLDSWHALALPLFRRAFPNVSWVFLYRDPVEVLVSQMHQRGMQMVPEIVPASLYGLPGLDGTSLDSYSAQVLGKICEAAADGLSLGGGLLVNYRDLPEAFWSRILPHFGVDYGAQDSDIMSRAARYDAKAPHAEFVRDSDSKQREATDLIRAEAERHVRGIYRRLEAISTGGATTACPSAAATN
jgi:hypothetical protein